MLDVNSIDMIGKNVEIKNSSDPSKIGLKGKVIFESKNMLVIESKNKIVKLKKNEVLSLKQSM